MLGLVPAATALAPPRAQVLGVDASEQAMEAGTSSSQRPHVSFHAESPVAITVPHTRNWTAGSGMHCSECQRVVRDLQGYCHRQRPMGDLDLECFDCTWAHKEIPGCNRIMALIAARPGPSLGGAVRTAA